MEIVAAHNRAIIWYQAIQKLSPARRAIELEKWHDYVSKLPTKQLAKTVN
jgi:hypothetical protein